MRFKHLVLALLTLMPTIFAFSVVPFNDKVNITQNSFSTVKYQIILGTHDINATIENTTGLPEGMLASYSKTFFTTSDVLLVTLTSEEPEFGNYTLKIKFKVFSDGNSTHENISLSDSVTVFVVRNEKICFNKPVMEKTVLNIGTQNVSVESVGADVTLKINEDLESLGEGEDIDIGNYKLHVVEIFPTLKAVKLMVTSEDTCPTINYVIDKDGDGVPDYEDECPDQYGEQENGCPKPKIKKLMIIRMEGETMRRGERFYFRVLENDTNEPVGGANVIFTNMDNGEVIGTCITDQYGIGSVMVEDDIESDRVLATVEKPGYTGSSEVYNFPEPYEEYIKKKTLVIDFGESLTNKTIMNTVLKGIVVNKNGDSVGKAEVEILKDGEKLKTLETNDKGEFTYKCTINGTLVFRPTKEKYKYEEATVEVLQDTDRDGVPDIYDKCPDKRGTENNSGCPEVKPEFVVLDKNGKRAGFDGLKPNEKYTISLVDEKTNNVIPYTGIIYVNNKVKNMTDGKAMFEVEKPGYYTINIETDEFNTTSTFKALEQKEDMGWLYLLMAISLIAVAVYFLFARYGRKGSFSEPRFLVGKVPGEVSPPPGSKGVG